jgi:serralysin
MVFPARAENADFFGWVVATPTRNSVGTTDINPVSTGIGKYLIDGPKWGGGLGQGVTLTYSFPSGTAYRDPDYSYGNEWGQWLSLSSEERVAVRDALAIWSRFANVRFYEVADNQTTVGELRFTYTKNIGSGTAAHAYLPGDYAAAGDVWFSWVNFNADGGKVPPGTDDFHTILHEVGHALGLKHPFDMPNAMPSKQDNYFYTIMSYTASPWSMAGDSWASFYPTTPMYYDLVAIQALYGKARVNTGNDTYLFKDGSYYWQAINDSGGVDTIVYSGLENTRINLNPGAFSSLSEAIRFNGGKSSRDTVTIGPGVVIENATGGSGHDTLTGNGVANVLNGSAGNDVLYGGAGNDTLYGGVGNDALHGSVGNDRLVGNIGADRMYGGASNDAYHVDNINDLVDESMSGSGGIDTVLSTISFSLADKVRVHGPVENLILQGALAVFGVGNSLHNGIVGSGIANLLDGRAGNDTLNGGLGNDTLIGGAGKDTFVFNTMLGGTNVDTISGFVAADDTIKLDNAVFTALTNLGELAASAFARNTTGFAQDAYDRIIYETDTGWLNYDFNGNASGGGIHFASIATNLALSSADFYVV